MTFSDEQVTEGVTELLFDYAECVDLCEPDAWAELFCDDGVFDEGREIQGRDRLARHVRKLLAMFDATSHHVTNVRVTRTGEDTASARSHVYAWHQTATGDQFEVWGRYLDRARFEDGRWRFAYRTVEVFGTKGIDASSFPRAPRGSVD